MKRYNGWSEQSPKKIDCSVIFGPPGIGMHVWITSSTQSNIGTSTSKQSQCSSIWSILTLYHIVWSAQRVLKIIAIGSKFIYGMGMGYSPSIVKEWKILLILNSYQFVFKWGITHLQGFQNYNITVLHQNNINSYLQRLPVMAVKIRD